MSKVSLLKVLSVAGLVLFLLLFCPQLNYPAQAAYCRVTSAGFSMQQIGVPSRSIKICEVEPQ